jgi:diguanylate cyclase (GGDEF)-like protein
MDQKSETIICPAYVPTGATEAGGSREAYLVQLAGGTPGALFRLSRGSHAIGRGSESALCVLDPSVSRRHVVIEVPAPGEVWLRDVGSTNGTYRNGVRVGAGERIRLIPGDVIRLGTTTQLKFTYPDATEADLHKELFERAVRDPLTGLYNRRYFLEHAQKLAVSTTWRDLGLAILLLDLDHFKQVNDQFGHSVGDAILKDASGILRQMTRADDLVARYGGEEFIVALPIRTIALASERAERYRSRIAQREYQWNGKTLRMTTSIGVAYAAPQTMVAVDRLIAAADRALYQAKDGGRNRVVVYTDALDSKLAQTTVDHLVDWTRYADYSQAGTS